MPALYNALVAKVRDWSNRDAESLPDTIIQDSLRYAADSTYRELRIPALEAVATYTITEDQAGTNTLTIPDDLSEFISLRRTTGSGVSSALGTLGGSGNSIVYNQKADYRTFQDIDARAYDANRWTRRQNQLIVAPDLNEGDVFELFYYRRLPALNARYSVTQANLDASRLTVSTADVTGARQIGGTGAYYLGNEAPNWLRDEQEKVLIWGSLTHVFDYLGEDAMMQKFFAKWQAEVQQLNNEENQRKASGGNVQQNFNGFLI